MITSILLSLLLCNVLFGVSALQSAMFQNTDTITLPVFGPANPYPSEINVTLDVHPQKIVLTFYDVEDDYIGDWVAILVSPSGKKATLMSVMDQEDASIDGATFSISDYDGTEQIWDAPEIIDGTTYFPTDELEWGDLPPNGDSVIAKIHVLKEIQF